MIEIALRAIYAGLVVSGDICDMFYRECGEDRESGSELSRFSDLDKLAAHAQCDRSDGLREVPTRNVGLRVSFSHVTSIHWITEISFYVR